MSQHPSSSPRIWPYVIAAVLALAVAVALLFGGGGEEPSAESSPSEQQPTNQASDAVGPTREAASEDSDETPGQDQETSEQRESEAASPSSSAPSSESEARRKQKEIEEAAVDEAVAELSQREKAQARQRAEAFIVAAHERAWDYDRQQWVKDLEESASPTLVEKLNKDRDWDSQERHEFEQSKSITTVSVISAEPNLVTDGTRVEVAVELSTSTESDDPWLVRPPQKSSETVVVDLEQDRAVEHYSMQTSGGL